MMDGDEKLPAGWVKVKSKTRKGKIYFHNERRKISVWRFEDLKDFDKNVLDNSDKSKMQLPKTSAKHLSNTPKKLPPGTSDQSKTIKKNIARDRMTKLKTKLATEVKQGKESKIKEHANIVENVSSKNFAAKRMKSLKDKLKNEIKVTTKALEETIKEATDDTSAISQDNDMMEISFEDQPDDFEAMDWEDIPEQTIIDEVQKVRTTDNTNGKESLFTKQKSRELKGDFFIVVDTNVLLSNLDFVKEIKGKVFKDIGKASIYLPYIVLCELDRIKSRNDNLARLARRAINFIDECFKAKDYFLTGESALESAKNKIIAVESGDDEILNCCLKMLETTGRILLLTNDKNLRNKAFVNKIESYSRDMLNLKDYNAKNEINFS